MVNILAVSDEELLDRDFRLKIKLEEQVDILINCGDLSPSYMEYLIFEFRPLTTIMVHGNHDRNFINSTQINNYSPENSGYSSIYKGINILTKDYFVLDESNTGIDLKEPITFAGFSGIKSHGQWPFFFKDKQVKTFNKYLKFNNFFKQFGEIDIFLSHSPPKIKNMIPNIDHYHRPSKELGQLYQNFKPKIWFYGHIHKKYTPKNLDFLISDENNNQTYLINTVPYKFIEFNEETKEVKLKDFEVEYKKIRL